ncbi:MAG: hypothetical protein LKI24_03660 [Acidipropionibacterium sp.]|nr:hypothetical protein [Acidipropionibacterium sp.]
MHEGIVEDVHHVAIRHLVDDLATIPPGQHETAIRQDAQMLRRQRLTESQAVRQVGDRAGLFHQLEQEPNAPSIAERPEQAHGVVDVAFIPAHGVHHASPMQLLQYVY